MTNASQLMQAVTDLDEHTQASEKALAKHTPGPWETRDANNQPGHQQVWGGGMMVADCETLVENETAVANARLISAAPDLLEALWFVQKWMKMRSDKGEVFPSQLVNSVHEAIAKAEWSQS